MRKYPFSKVMIALILIMMLFSSFIVTCEKAADLEVLHLEEVNEERIGWVVDSLSKNQPILLNLWATWCAPCIEEFDDLVALDRNKADSLAVYFISADFKKEKAIEFLEGKDILGWSGFKTGKDEEFINALSVEWSGALPFTQIIYKGKVLDQWENKLPLTELHARVNNVLEEIKY